MFSLAIHEPAAAREYAHCFLGHSASVTPSPAAAPGKYENDFDLLPTTTKSTTYQKTSRKKNFMFT